MAGDPLPVTVIIPAYQREDLVGRAVRSALGQTRPPAEVLVVDDCSADRTAQVAADAGARVVRREQNGGESAARNTALEHATQPWIATLDSDDEWLPGHLETAWALRDGHVLVALSTLTCAADPAHDRFQGALGSRPRVLRSPAAILWPENITSASALLYRRDAALAAGGYPVGVRHAGDLDFLLRLLEHGTGVVSPRIGAIYHQHADQVSLARSTMRDAHAEAITRYAGRPWWTPSVGARWDGARAWDDLRAAAAEGDRRAALRHAARMVSHPQRAVGAAGMLVHRLRGRRQVSRMDREGRPTVAVLRGAPADGEAVVDLRDLSAAQAAARLLRRPTAAARVATPAQAVLVALAGVRPRRR